MASVGHGRAGFGHVPMFPSNDVRLAHSQLIIPPLTVALTRHRPVPYDLDVTLREHPSTKHLDKRR